ncbi:hypothetical protein NDU88_005994 [Pleurodeles waltl]|uniref:Uncharacterized protein n=1 Tax=Pleurodeles waltl TaxID=8319 RepID=A0AAV7QJL3_PLEWA|nr:hypothetical protein NDU88_005994 [Pleurodeles waltl]
MDRQGRGPREHRQQAGGAPKGILTAAVQLRSETENRRCTAGFPLPWAPPWGFRPPYRHPLPGGFGRQEQDGGMGCRGAPGGPCSAHANGMGTAGAPVTGPHHDFQCLPCRH